jgi:hypothetical protein
MPFTDEQVERIYSVINERLGEWSCSQCRASDWSIFDNLVYLYSSAGDGTAWGCVAMYCVNCGDTRLLFTPQLGLEDLHPEPVAQGASEGKDDGDGKGGGVAEAISTIGDVILEWT